MNGSTDVRSTGSTSSPISSKTDRELPLNPSVSEVAGSPSGAAVQPRGVERMISGIDLIDYGAGGLTPNGLYVVKGGIGVGKSIFGLQFLTRGLEHQEPGILITDQKPERVLEQARSIGFALDEAVRRNQLAILNPSGRYFELVESPADVMAIVEELGDLAKRIGAKRLVIDPIFTLINTSYSSHFALAITQSLLNALEDLPLTTLLITGAEDAELTPVVRTLEQNAAGVIELAQDPSTGGRIMRMPKLRHGANENLSAHYRILNGRGIINYRGEGEHVSDVTKPWEENAQLRRTLLVIGAQPETIRRVRESLGSDYEVQAESELKAGVERAKREKPALVLITPSRAAGAVGAILDLAQNSTSSVAFLSPAGNRQADKVLYLRAGADDFITEPFTPAEFRARVDALVRRSGRRLNMRDTSMGSITPDELSSLMQTSDPDATQSRRRGPMLHPSGDSMTFDPQFNDRLQRNIDTVSKFDQPFALYWIKADEDPELNRSLAQLCRQEDIVCHNRNGEFVAILTGTDESGVKGFETRLSEKLGNRLNDRVKRGYRLHKPGEATENLVPRN
jgi:KaiC/GvpD/RAD55 family RecA-like ATPase/DNA-binding response OmpR family regulator